MKTLFSWTHNMLVFAERGFVRLLMMAVGFVLFLVTIVVNVIARWLVARTARAGAGI